MTQARNTPRFANGGTRMGILGVAKIRPVAHTTTHRVGATWCGVSGEEGGLTSYGGYT
jgi:hypothetical protein